MLVENWCFRKSKDLLGVCGQFSATVKLPIPGGGQHLRMSGLYPQAYRGLYKKSAVMAVEGFTSTLPTRRTKGNHNTSKNGINSVLLLSNSKVNCTTHHDDCIAWTVDPLDQSESQSQNVCLSTTTATSKYNNTNWACIRSYH